MESFYAETIDLPKVESLGPNQYVVNMSNFRIFLSYDKTIAVEDRKGRVALDEKYWDCSVTTKKYLYRFLGLKGCDVRKNVEKEVYELRDLQRSTLLWT